jgi:hypothetical protein
MEEALFLTPFRQPLQVPSNLDSRLNYRNHEALFLTPFRQPLQVTSNLDSRLNDRNHEEEMWSLSIPTFASAQRRSHNMRELRMSTSPTYMA